jgi:hypothetical protein
MSSYLAYFAAGVGATLVVWGLCLLVDGLQERWLRRARAEASSPAKPDRAEIPRTPHTWTILLESDGKTRYRGCGYCGVPLCMAGPFRLVECDRTWRSPEDHLERHRLELRRLGQ